MIKLPSLLAALFCLLACSLPLAAQEFVGSQTCAGCHQTEYDNWQTSHHRHAMAVATAETMLGNFDDAVFEHFGQSSRFFREDNGYFVETDNSRGEVETFRVAYTLGYYPLQQYLVEFPDGRLQALSISWDSRPAAEGGQRWYHLYPDEAIEAGDPLHWTGTFQNWNSRCASCHTTNLVKGYSQASDTYQTTWSETGVGCEGCHGAGAAHLTWARGDRTAADKGLLANLAPIWEPVAGQMQVPAQDSVAETRQLTVCSGCHARRSELQQFDASADFADNFSLTPLLEGLYHPDGQILDEVFEAGSFLQSRMHQNQVSCSNCHEPHSNQVRVAGNGLCLQCHAEPTYQSEQHFFHTPESSGAQCVNCHMPARTYMGVDPRRDHSFRRPDPLASVVHGVPNACTQCHTDRSDQWAADFLTARTGQSEPYYRHAATLAGARAGNAAVVPELLALAGAAEQPAVLRSIAMLESARFPSQQHLGVVLAALRSPEATVRMNAASSLAFLAPELRLQYLADLVTDPVKSVRMAVARQLAPLPDAQVPPALRARFDSLLTEYQQSLLFNADMPESMSDLGVFHMARGNLPAAEAALLHARKLAPRYLPAMLNLADVYRAQGRDGPGEALLEEALVAWPESADVRFALGLLHVRTGRRDTAVPLLLQASTLAPDNARYVYVYAVALAETGGVAAALDVLDRAALRFPDDPQIRTALRAYRQ